MVLEIVASFSDSWLFEPTVLVGGGLAGAYLYKTYLEGDEFEEELLEEVIQGEIESTTELFGPDLDKTVRYGMHEIGTITSAHRKTVALEMDPSLDADGDDESDDDDEDEADDGEVLDDDEVEPFLTLIVKPSSLSGRVSWYITDNLLGMSRSTEYMAVPEKYVSDHDDMVISNSWEPTLMGGVWTSDSRAGVSFMRSMTFKGMVETTLSTAKDAVRAVSQLNISQVNEMLKMELAGQIEKDKYGSDMEEFFKGD